MPQSVGTGYGTYQFGSTGYGPTSFATYTAFNGFGGSSRPSRTTAEDAASPLGNPIPKLIGVAVFTGQLIVDVDHFGGVRLA